MSNDKQTYVVVTTNTPYSSQIKAVKIGNNPILVQGDIFDAQGTRVGVIIHDLSDERYARLTEQALAAGDDEVYFTHVQVQGLERVVKADTDCEKTAAQEALRFRLVGQEEWI